MPPPITATRSRFFGRNITQMSRGSWALLALVAVICDAILMKFWSRLRAGLFRSASITVGGAGSAGCGYDGGGIMDNVVDYDGGYEGGYGDDGLDGFDVEGGARRLSIA